jgi:hypothetical protein
VLVTTAFSKPVLRGKCGYVTAEAYGTSLLWLKNKLWTLSLVKRRISYIRKKEVTLTGLLTSCIGTVF